jgi:hypothetical protein
MQKHPDPTELLDALAAFLQRDVEPAIAADRALRFRVLIARSLLGSISAELRNAPELRAAERERLIALLDATPDAPMAELDADLARRIRAGDLDHDTVRAHLMATLRAWLEAVDPGFDLRVDIEK